MEKPVDGMNTSAVVGERVIDKPELPPQGMSTDTEVYTETVEAQIKRGTYGHFEVFCDEGARIGGSDKHPYPLIYMAMGTGF